MTLGHRANSYSRSGKGIRNRRADPGVAACHRAAFPVSEATATIVASTVAVNRQNDPICSLQLMHAVRSPAAHKAGMRVSSESKADRAALQSGLALDA